MKAILKRMLPSSVRSKMELESEVRALAALKLLPCDTSNLRNSVPDFRNLDLASEWQEVLMQLERLNVGDKSGAINPGDRRAIYYLARALKPGSVLEVGTHLGASTSMLALALKKSQVANPRLTTVDILDVNGPEGAWVRLNSKHSPKSLMRELSCDFVEFVVSPSVAFLNQCQARFDLIFLDGGHESTTVYQEVPAALKLLDPGGLILLHDFYPNQSPLWSDGAVVPGPWLAIQRFKAEGVPMKVESLGALPWPTKLNSNITSLACLIAE